MLLVNTLLHRNVRKLNFFALTRPDVKKQILSRFDTHGCEEDNAAAGAGGVGKAAVKTRPFPVNLEVARKGVCILS